MIERIRSLYEQQRAAVRTSAGITKWFEIGQGVRQWCILPPYLFNVFSEMIMRVKWMERGTNDWVLKETGT